jgi:hypothetical protein
LEYVAVFYGVAAAAGMFNAVCALLLAGFLAYQLSIIAAGTTTYEAAKLRELAAVRRRGGGGADAGVGAGAVTALAGTGAAAAAAVSNPFDRGSVWANFREVLFPDAFIEDRLRASASASGLQQVSPVGEAGGRGGEATGGLSQQDVGSSSSLRSRWLGKRV